MPSHRYFWFYMCTMALLVTYASARKPSEDTPYDEIVSCVYPMSGQYALLPRILFYASLICASTMRRYWWLTTIVLGVAMPYSLTAFVHMIVILATHGFNPPIFDLDIYGIFVLSAASVSMYPVLIVLRRRYKIRAVHAVVRLWWSIMVVTGFLASDLVSKSEYRQGSSNSEVACYLEDGALLTSIAQLNGTRDLECIYDCFLAEKSVLKAQDAVTIIWGDTMHGMFGKWGTLVAFTSACIMYLLGTDMKLYSRVFKRLDALVLKPVYSAFDPDGRAILTPVACICLISMVPWVINIEYSLWRTPVEEKAFAIGQWSPWVAALFAIIGGGIYRVYKDPKDGEEAPELPINSPGDSVMTVGIIEPGDNNPAGAFPEANTKGDTNGSDESRLLDEIDLGAGMIIPEPEC
ncbi:hypothetical protein V492_04294 [Pseudogymnoascus sp. VKM F-4246]|nr:hypothetical protein V492_04294 [Pseudogymnoascus sp. VKM F-4246]